MNNRKWSLRERADHALYATLPGDALGRRPMPPFVDDPAYRDWPEWREPVPGQVVADEQTEHPDIRPASVLAGPKHHVFEEMEGR